MDARALRTIRARRAALREAFDLAGDFETLEESCVPSYCHPNPLASGVSWLRLVTAARLARRLGARPPILDFGSATGELYHLLGGPEPYHFVEENEILASALRRWIPAARRETLETLADRRFATIFALDSLEHNEDVETLADALVRTLRPGGLLVLSGPTENGLYRLGRRIAGFTGHYHVTTIYDIERCFASRAERRALRRIPPLAPLFRVTAWGRDTGGPEATRPAEGPVR